MTELRECPPISRNPTYELENLKFELQDPAQIALVDRVVAAWNTRADGWLPIAECKIKNGEGVIAWREDAGQFLAFFGTMELFNLSDEEIEAWDEETFFTEDWWTFGFDGPYRLEGDLTPTKFMPLPTPPT